jgi:hypothetical protein
MPYVDQVIRDKPDGAEVETPGELNFMISNAIGFYIQSKGLSYGSINEAIGILECAKLELYRRIAAPYEEQKKFENGDIEGYEELCV